MQINRAKRRRRALAAEEETRVQRREQSRLATIIAAYLARAESSEHGAEPKKIVSVGTS